MGTELVKAVELPSMAAIESVLVQGDLSKLSTEQRVEYYNRVCNSLGLNPMTKPFEYVSLQGRLMLYARKDATDQLRKIYNVSVKIISREKIEDIYIVTARAAMPNGREDEAIGTVFIAGLRGEQLANAMMKAESKAKRRVTLSICGLGFSSEDEISDTNYTHKVEVEMPKQQLPAADVTIIKNESAAPMTIGGDKTVTRPQLNRLFAIANANMWPNAELKTQMQKMFPGILSSTELNPQQYEQLVRYIEEHPFEPLVETEQEMTK
jgi:hypothetical protein